MLLSNPFVSDPRVYAEVRALSENGYDVTVVAWDRTCAQPETEDRDGIHIRRVRVRATFGQGTRQLLPFLAFWRQAIAALSQEKVDVVHCHDLDTLFAGWVVARRQCAGLVYDAHECYPAMFAVHGSPLISRLLETVDRGLSRQVDVVITVGQRLAARFRAMTPKPVFVVGNWKNSHAYQIDAEHIRAVAKRLGIGDRLVVSYIGGINQGRVFPPLIAAAKNRPRVFLIIAGDGSQRQAVTRLMEEMNNGVYLGQVPLADVPQYVALSDVVYYGLNASSPNNQFSAPNALFAALAAGKAVLTTSVGEIAQIVREEDCGIVLDTPSAQTIESALERLENRAFLHQCKQNATHAGQAKYNWGNAQRVLLGIYKDLAA